MEFFLLVTFGAREAEQRAGWEVGMRCDDECDFSEVQGNFSRIADSSRGQLPVDTSGF